MNGAVRFYKKKQTKDGKTMRRTKEKEIVVKEGDSRISLVYVQQIILFFLNEMLLINIYLYLAAQSLIVEHRNFFLANIFD